MLHDISPIDGRYESQTSSMRIFSEGEMIKARANVELWWLYTFAKAIGKPIDSMPNINDNDVARVKEIERETRHDVKAIEYMLRERVDKSQHWMLHFGLTSEDVSNIAYAYSIRKALTTICDLQRMIVEYLAGEAAGYVNLPMLSHTHGQPASPTTYGKELAVFAVRLERQRRLIQSIQPLAKLAGASGNFNALHHAYPEVDWINVAANFVRYYGLKHTLAVTQIEPHDWMSELFDAIARFNTIMIDLCRDMWQYISMGYVVQMRSSSREVGSSTMPHKVNPINFENAEGNCGVSNALLRHMSSTLPTSRMQRDLTDSTVMRNIGVALSHHIVAISSLSTGLRRVTPDEDAIREDLLNHTEVISEALQTMGRKEGSEVTYEEWMNTEIEPSKFVDAVFKYVGLAPQVTQLLIAEAMG